MLRGGDLCLGLFVLATRLGHGRWSVSEEWNEENEMEQIERMSSWHVLQSERGSRLAGDTRLRFRLFKIQDSRQLSVGF
jgi:hypothetical protein